MRYSPGFWPISFKKPRIIFPPLS